MKTLPSIVRILPAIMVLCFPVAVAAQEFGKNDYGLLFEMQGNAFDEVIREDGVIVRTMVLPGQVTVTEYEEDGKFRYVAEDDGVPTGHQCLIGLLISTQQSFDRCTNIGTDEQSARIDDMIGRLGAYISDNTIPKYPIEKLWLELNVLRDESRGLAKDCGPMDEDTERFVENILSDEIYHGLDESLSVPKLQVPTFCMM